MDPSVLVQQRSIVALDTPTGAGKTRLFRDHVERYPESRWMVVVFRVSLAEHLVGSLHGLGFADYRETVLSTVDPETCPRLIICVSSLQKVTFLTKEEDSAPYAGPSWNVRLDGVGQTKAMTCVSHGGHPRCGGLEYVP